MKERLDDEEIQEQMYRDTIKEKEENKEDTKHCKK